MLPPLVALAAGPDPERPEVPEVGPRAPEPEVVPGGPHPEPATEPGREPEPGPTFPAEPEITPPTPAVEPGPPDWTSGFESDSEPILPTGAGVSRSDTGPRALLPEHTASDRMEPEAPAAQRPRRAWGAALALVGVLALAALVVTFAYLRQRDEGEAPDLLSLAAERAAEAQVAVATERPEVAHRFILDQFGWPLEVPRLEGAALTGVGLDPLAEGVELPFLRYRTPEGTDVTVYAFDYAFLDAAARQVSLAPAIYAHLADPAALDVRRQRGRHLVVWRRRAAIYAAVTEDEAAARALAEEVSEEEG